MVAGSGQFSGQKAKIPHLSDGELKDLREDIGREFVANAAIAVEEWTNPAAADVDAIVTDILSVTTARTLSGSQLNGVVGAGVLDPPRNITVTTASSGTPADVPPTTTINGLDVNGNAQSEVLTISQTAATVAGAKAFSKVTSIVETAGQGTAGTLSYGFGAKLGLNKKLKVRAGALAVLAEVAGGAVLAPGSTTGTFVTPATGAPNGTYAPAAAPNGTLDYALFYEYDASLNR